MARPILQSMLLGTTDVDRLRDWYVKAFSAEVNEFGVLDLGGFGLVIEQRDDVADKTVEPGRVIVNFHVEDAAAVAAHLNDVAVTWLVELERREPGWFATMVDPDGNYVQIIQFAPEHA